MNNYFNTDRYKELLELEKSGKFSSFNIELISLAANVEKQVIYNRKKDYFMLIDHYLSQVISPHDFRVKFSKMVREDARNANVILEDFQKLEVFTLATDLEQFTNSMFEIETLCGDYYEMLDDTTELMPEDEFYNLVSQYYIQLEKFK